MMKKILYGMMAATMIFATSCENELKVGAAGEESMVSFTIATPDMGSRAEYSDGTTATVLQYAVYDAEGNILGDLTKLNATINGSTTVNLQLTTGNSYSVIFWAEAPNAPYDVDFAEKLANAKMTVDYTNAVSNDESRDAFYAVKEINVTGAQTEKVELRRPFAQLNIGTSDYAASDEAGYVPTSSSVTVKNVYSTLNFATGEVAGEGEVTFAENAIDRSQTFPVAGYEYLAMNYVLVGVDKTVVDVEFTYTDGTDAKTRTVGSVPVQRNYRTNIYGQLLTSDVDVNVEIEPDYDGEEYADVICVSSADELLKTLASAQKETVKIVMLNDITIPGGTAAYTTNAKDVIIEGNPSYASRGTNNAEKLTLTFKDSYRTYIKLSNPEAKITFNNLNINRETTGGSHWHDNNMKFCCNAEFNNVAFNKGICLDDAKKFVLNNCSINKGKVATYGMFITAGCNVTIDGLSITHSEGVAGRGIKIVDEDVANKDAMTTLSVSNATFVTEAKAAIIVGSKGGANITLNNINLAGVKADGFNAVWVDEDYKNYASNVTVEGGFMIVEGTAADSNPFLEEGTTVNVAKGVYSTLPKVANGVTIIAEEGTVFNGTSSVSGENVTIKNVIFKGDEQALTGSLKGTTFENCQFDATYGAQWCYAYGDVTFKNCVFGSETSKRGIHFDGGNGNVLFDSCTFYAFNALGQANKKYTFNNCDIKVSKKALNNFNGVNMYGTTYEYNNCRFAPGTFTDCASNNVVASYNECSYTDGRSIYSIVRFDKDKSTCTITFDGYRYVANGVGMKDDAYYLFNAEGLMWFANEVNTNKNAFNGKTVKLNANIDLAGIDWEPIGQTGNTTFNGVFDGQEYTISNLSVDSESETGKHYSSGLFGWVESHTAGHGHVKNVNIAGATIKGHHNCGALVGYITQETALVENCHVTGAEVICSKANDDADGDKAGALIGNATVATPVKGCTASNSTVSAGRDAGQVIGAGKQANVTECSATNVTVTANGTSTGNNVRNEVIGRLL